MTCRIWHRDQMQVGGFGNVDGSDNYNNVTRYQHNNDKEKPLLSLKQYWQQALASIRKSPAQPPQLAPRPSELEREISAITRDNKALSDELSQVRTHFEQARTEDSRKIAALEQLREKTEAHHNLDREKFAELERRIDELETGRDQTAELERRINELETGRDQTREQTRTLQASLATTATRLEATSNQIREVRDLAEDQARTFEASLSHAATRIDNTEDYVRSVEMKLGNKHRLFAKTLQEIQLDQRRQDQRANWTIITAGFALLLVTITGAILIWNMQNNAGVLANINDDMQSLMTSINEHPGLHTELPGPPPLPALPTEEPIQPEAVSPTASKVLPDIRSLPQAAKPATTSAPADNYLPPDNDRETTRLAKRLSTPSGSRQDASTFFEENATKAGIVELPSGLQYRVVKAGSGTTPTMTDKVVVDFLAATPEGKVIDQTYFAGKPATYRMNEVSPGLREALLQMQEGAEWEVFVPPQLAQKRGVRKRSMVGFEPTVYLVQLQKVIVGDTPGQQ
jgi:FKBP-type peptidyl-prolyl cis-trans isomerase